jgi:predicted MFS family arabinose efflux permease
VGFRPLSSAAGHRLVGLFNIAGSLIWGWLGSRYAKKDMLALLYALRALAFMMFLAFETNIHYPTDTSLLGDEVRVLPRTDRFARAHSQCRC